MLSDFTLVDVAALRLVNVADSGPVPYQLRAYYHLLRFDTAEPSFK
jgi:hypothetical protein